MASTITGAQDLTTALPSDMAQGGTIVAGTYLLTSETYYQGSTPNAQDQQTLYFFAGGTWAKVVGASMVDGGTYDVLGSTMTLLSSCPDGVITGDTVVEYTATSTTMTEWNLSGNYAQVWTKQ